MFLLCAIRLSSGICLRAPAAQVKHSTVFAVTIQCCGESCVQLARGMSWRECVALAATLFPLTHSVTCRKDDLLTRKPRKN